MHGIKAKHHIRDKHEAISDVPVNIGFLRSSRFSGMQDLNREAQLMTQMSCYLKRCINYLKQLIYSCTRTSCQIYRFIDSDIIIHVYIKHITLISRD